MPTETPVKPDSELAEKGTPQPGSQGEFKIVRALPARVIKRQRTSKAGLSPELIVTAHGSRISKHQAAAVMNLIPELVRACERSIMALEANGAPNCEAVKECRAAIYNATRRKAVRP